MGDRKIKSKESAMKFLAALATVILAIFACFKEMKKPGQNEHLPQPDGKDTFDTKNIYRYAGSAAPQILTAREISWIEKVKDFDRKNQMTRTINPLAQQIHEELAKELPDPDRLKESLKELQQSETSWQTRLERQGKKYHSPGGNREELKRSEQVVRGAGHLLSEHPGNLRYGR